MRHRHEILKAVSKLLGRSASLSERAFQSLELVTRKGSTPSDVHVWKALESRVPTLHLLYQQMGIDFTTIGSDTIWPSSIRRFNPSHHQINWPRLLRKLLTVEEQNSWEYRLTPAACDVAATDGFLGTEALAASILQSGTVKPNGDRVPSRVTFVFAKAAGLSEPRFWSSGHETLVAGLVATLGAMEVIDPSSDRQQYVLYSDGHGTRLEPFGTFGSYQFGKQPLADGSLLITRANIVDRSGAVFSDATIAEL